MAYEKYVPQSIPVRYPTVLLEIGDKKKTENFQRASLVWITRSSGPPDSNMWHVPGIRDEPRRCEDHVYCVTLELGQSSLREEVLCSFIGWCCMLEVSECYRDPDIFLFFFNRCLDVLSFLLWRNNVLESVFRTVFHFLMFSISSCHSSIVAFQEVLLLMNHMSRCWRGPALWRHRFFFFFFRHMLVIAYTYYLCCRCV